MALESGIKASQELQDVFAKAVDNNSSVRFIKIVIDNETLQAEEWEDKQGDFEADFPRIQSHLAEKSPCYICFKLDSPGWLFVAYVPDFAKVRDKMLYASTRSALKKCLGEPHFVDELYGLDKNDLSLDAYYKHKQSVAATVPLTEREEEIQRMRKEESGADIGITTKKAHVHGVSFPVSDDARTALGDFASGTLNYVQLALNMENETIFLSHSGNVDAAELASLTPESQPRYHFFRYRHAFEDNTFDSVVFIYSCPMRSKVRERMLYSSCKAAVAAVGQECGVEAEKASEVSDAVELTENFVFEELHPKKVDDKKTFKKPMRPGRVR
jgi:twinfilin-like protein